ncbi:hypothetical protein [Klebsiella variicola]|uniref:hypothetical protein n=1 Tax=Klebsiella variicola TaxID=244366 RepID=UPI0004A03FA0|nr:hypothetical protein [Klebsiella variicola]KDH28289.1 hypothetical protein AE36_01197 [Klebsiella variicola]QKK55415.1 hypothetical protein HL854_15785 [Klebsiella variicola]HDS7205434.1 hypothetical protein [Klebsiella quasipneumoniae subsp. similipneumoniae]
MARNKSRDLEIYNYIKENKHSLYSIKSLAVTLDITEEDVKKNLSSLRFGDQINYFMFGNDTFRVTDIANSFEEGQTDKIDKHWKQHTKKLVKIYREQGYTPEQCSEISDVDIETVNKYWSK